MKREDCQFIETLLSQHKVNVFLAQLTVQQTFFASYLTFSKASTAALGQPKLFWKKSSNTTVKFGSIFKCMPFFHIWTSFDHASSSTKVWLFCCNWPENSNLWSHRGEVKWWPHVKNWSFNPNSTAQIFFGLKAQTPQGTLGQRVSVLQFLAPFVLILPRPESSKLGHFMDK